MTHSGFADMHRDSDAMASLLKGQSDARNPAAQTAGRLDAVFLLNALNVGGSERKVIRLANELTRRGMRIGLVSLNGPEPLAPMVDPSVPRWRLDRRGKLSFRTIRALKAIVEQHGPRVIFCVNMYPTLYALAISIVRSQGARIIGLINTTDFGPRERWRQRFYSHVLKRLDGLVYGCRLQLDEWSRFSKALREEAQVIYNGVDVQEFSPTILPDKREEIRARFGFPVDAFVVGSVGRLVPEKNQAVLIGSVASLRAQGIDARLLIAGEGPLRQSLEQHAVDRGVADVVHLTGAVADVREILATFDVFALPSLYVETFSNAALEAMAMQTPVILSRIGGAAEMICDSKDGFLVEPQELSKRLPMLLRRLATDPVLRQSMAAQARRRVEQEFDFHNMVDKYASIIERRF